MIDILEKARKLRPHLETLSASLNDEDALDCIDIFPFWDGAATYAVDDRVQYNGNLYRCLTAHTANQTWNPVDAPSVWAKVLIPDSTTIPEWEQPDSTNAYMTGDKVMYNGAVYESLIDNNVWSPEAYPAGWKLVEGE